MKNTFIFGLVGLVIFLSSCVDDAQLEKDDLTGRWENVSPDPEDSSSVIVLYYEMKSDFTLEEGYLKRNLQSKEESYRFLATSEYAAKNGFLEFTNYTTYDVGESAGALEFVAKEKLEKYGPSLSRKMSYKLLESNKVLSVYQGCPADFCYDILYDKL
ncbi:hypothetical protein [uncultured Algoriphagus sp.]|uniref:hypothetical protein n=1 Tax=uncultured Algoriphagus sp. TaxID=417365 RepID=UPI0030EEE39A|tara:strand:+ start:16101 stop:16574 length:474 start_codon:yes stop_codon:yes gene_type:complete